MSLRRRILFLVMVLAIIAFGFDVRAARKTPVHDSRVVAYVTSWSGVMPDPSDMTNVIYAFGHVNDTFDGVRIDNPERLRRIAQLKQENPKLKIY